MIEANLVRISPKLSLNCLQYTFYLNIYLCIIPSVLLKRVSFCTTSSGISAVTVDMQHAVRSSLTFTLRLQYMYIRHNLQSV